MPFTPEQMREYRRGLKAAGICTHCHRNKPSAGRVICRECMDKMVPHNAAKRRMYARDPHRCAGCGRQTPSGGLCEMCAKRNRDYHRRLRKRRAEQGICIRCGVKLPENSPSQCGVCSEHYSQVRAIWRACG